MEILVVQESEDLGRIWCSFLERRGLQAHLATSIDDAVAALRQQAFDALVFDPAAAGGGLPLADYATYRNPDLKILAVTTSTFFSDRTVFEVIPNARGVLHQPVRPEDLAAYLEYFNQQSERAEAGRARSA